MLKPPDAPRVLFVGSYRSDEAAASTFLKTWHDVQRKHEVRLDEGEVKLAPLTVEECTELVIGLLGRDDEGIRRRAVEFARETRGNPFLLIELVGCFDPDTDSFEPLPLHEVLGRKLGRLPDEAGHLLEVVAVSGQALSLDEASRTAGHDSPPIATITRMRNERLVRMVGPDDRPMVDTYHDRVRETILGRLDEEKCRTIHGTLADVIASEVGASADELETRLVSWETAEGPAATALPRVYDLAYHYDAAGGRAPGLDLCPPRRRTGASTVGARGRREQLRDRPAQRGPDAIPAAARYRISEGYGAALMLLGRYQEAAEAARRDDRAGRRRRTQGPDRGTPGRDRLQTGVARPEHRPLRGRPAPHGPLGTPGPDRPGVRDRPRAGHPVLAQPSPRTPAPRAPQ